MAPLSWLSMLCAGGLTACGLFDESGADADAAPPDGTVADVAGDATAAGPEASGSVTRYGVASYEIATVDEATTDFRVTLRGKDGIALGVIDVFADPAGLVATMPSPDGLLTYRATTRLGGDGYVMSTSFGTADFQLRLDTTSAIDGAGGLTLTDAVLVAPIRPGAGPLSDPWFDSPDEVALHLVGSSGERGLEPVARLLGIVTPENLRRSPELLRLTSAMLDPALSAAIETATAAFEPAAVNAIHLSPVCATLRQRIQPTHARRAASAPSSIRIRARSCRAA